MQNLTTEESAFQKMYKPFKKPQQLTVQRSLEEPFLSLSLSKMHVVHLELFVEAQMAPYGAFLFLYSALISGVAKHLGVSQFLSELMKVSLFCMQMNTNDTQCSVDKILSRFLHKPLYVWEQRRDGAS